LARLSARRVERLTFRRGEIVGRAQPRVAHLADGGPDAVDVAADSALRIGHTADSLTPSPWEGQAAPVSGRRRPHARARPGAPTISNDAREVVKLHRARRAGLAPLCAALC